MDEWWIDPIRRAVQGRRVVLAGAVAAAWTEHLGLLRAAGVSDVLVVATEGWGAGPLPDVDTIVVEQPPGGTEVEQIHRGNRTLAAPPREVVAALDRFDPGHDAVVIGSFLTTVSELAGRPLLAHRRPEWVALEDKTVIDEFWDRAGVTRLPCEVTGIEDAAAATDRIDRGDGTVWAADARDGFNGGACATFRVRHDDDRERVVLRLRGTCDRVRVMPFVEGIPCSVHGIVLPDGVAVLRPVEMVTLRRDEAFVYSGCGTFWDPEAEVRASMRATARRVGEQLASEVGFRGAFTVDGVVGSDGFWPTELNPRFGAGILTIARGTGIPIVLLNDLIVAGHDVGRDAAELEAEIVEHADERRSGGTWRAGLPHDLVEQDRPAVYDGTWRWARHGEPADGWVTAGSRFVRCRYEPATTPVGPATAQRATAFWDFLATLGVDQAGGLAGPTERWPSPGS